MNSRAYLLVALLVSPAWSAEPTVEAPEPTVRSFDLRTDAVKKIVRDTAATQFSSLRVSDKPSVEAEPDEFVYVPPEEPPAPMPEPSRKLPAPAPRSDSFLSAIFETLIEEALGIEGNDPSDVTFANDVLRCRIQKEQKTSPPGVDNCPSAD